MNPAGDACPTEPSAPGPQSEAQETDACPPDSSEPHAPAEASPPGASESEIPTEASPPAIPPDATQPDGSAPDIPAPERRVAITSAAEMVSMVPHLLGFHPSESLVMVVISDGTLLMTARADIDDIIEATGEPEDPATQSVELLQHLAHQEDGTKLCVLIYSDDDSRCAPALAWALETIDLTQTLDVITVREGRYISLLGRHSSPSGYPVTMDTPAARIAERYGGPPAASRQALIETLAAPQGAHAARCAEARQRAHLRFMGMSVERQRAHLDAVVDAGWGDPASLSLDDLAFVAVAAEVSTIRSHLVTRLDEEDPRPFIEIIEYVARATPTPERGQVLGMAALGYWVSGQDLKLAIAVDLGRIEQRSELGDLMSEVQQLRVPARAWPRIRQTIGMLSPAGVT